MPAHPRRSIPIDDDIWAEIQDIAEEEDRSPYIQAARMLRKAVATERLQRGGRDDDIN
jgi:hypothetical protein